MVSLTVPVSPLVLLRNRKKERTTDLVIQAVNAGFRGIDTACQPKVGAHSRSPPAADVYLSITGKT